MSLRYKGKSYTGKGVVVAVIDSGINQSDVRLEGTLVEGWRVRLRATNHVVIDDYFHDKVGHGTDMAAAILSEAPDADLVSIRIMDDEFKASADLMAVGIETAYKGGADIINLSLGTPNMGKAMLLRDCCAMARDAGSIMVASGHPKGGRAYPADIPEAVGVVSNPECRDRDFYFDPEFFPKSVWKGLSSKILSCGRQDVLEKSTYAGVGFAAARVSGRLACLREALPDASVEELLSAFHLLCTIPTVELGYC